jgi:hypothetical protein
MIEGGRIDLLSGATVSGSGALEIPVRNEGGLLSPGEIEGFSADTLTIDGGYTQLEGGSFQVEIAGTEPTPSHDRIEIMGTAKLNGTLILRGMAPLMNVGDHELQILTASSVDGVFSNVPEIADGGGAGHIGSGQFLKGVLYDDRQVTLTVFQADKGDSTGDGAFNSSDLVQVFQAGEFEDGVRGNSDWTEGDWTGDMEFDTTDLVRAFQIGSYEAGAPSVVAVPEPSTLALLAVFSLAVACCGRQRPNDDGDCA